MTETAIGFFQQVSDEFSIYAGEDRRTECRQRIMIPVLATPFDEEKRPTSDAFHAITRDLSESGIGLLSTRPVREKFLAILAQSMSTEEDMLVLIEITRCRRVGHYYDIGGSIVDTATR